MVNTGLRTDAPFPFSTAVRRCFEMIDDRLLDAIQSLIPKAGGRPPVIGIAGAQGCGKTTLAKTLAERRGGVAFSLDDLYLTKAERLALAGTVHPLLAVRGPPGTHDLDIGHAAIDGLTRGEAVALPRFDKLTDDRIAPTPCRRSPGIVVVEGWCLGATAEGEAALVDPVNALERDSDPLAVWRGYANAALAGAYQTFFRRFDVIVHLAAPSFDSVLAWRCEQEAGLLDIPPSDLPEARRRELAVFVQHFERVTRHMLAGGIGAGVVTLPLMGDRSLAV